MYFSITGHAIERYCDRINPGASAQRAREHIRASFRSASRQKEKTFDGKAYYLAADLRLVVAEEGGDRTVVTVLGLHEAAGGDAVPEEAVELAEAFRKYEDGLGSEEPAAASSRRKRQVAHIAQLDAVIRQQKKEIRDLKSQLAELRGLQPPMPPRPASGEPWVSGKRYEKMVRHAQLMTDDRARFRALVAPLLSLALGHHPEHREEVLEHVRAVEPGLVAHVEKMGGWLPTEVVP